MPQPVRYCAEHDKPPNSFSLRYSHAALIRHSLQPTFAAYTLVCRYACTPQPTLLTSMCNCPSTLGIPPSPPCPPTCATACADAFPPWEMACARAWAIALELPEAWAWARALATAWPPVPPAAWLRVRGGKRRQSSRGVAKSQGEGVGDCLVIGVTSSTKTMMIGWGQEQGREEGVFQST